MPSTRIGAAFSHIETTQLTDLSDVLITSPVDNDLLAYDLASALWINQTPSQAGLDSLYLKLTGSLADVSNHSHTVLTDIGTNTHAQIDTAIGTTIPATYAVKALSNLASVAINTSLVSDTDSTDNLGSTTVAWANLYVDTISSITGNALALTPIAGQSLTVNLATTGDFIVNTDDLVVDTSNGNVGIGTATPDSTARLEVAGRAYLGGGTINFAHPNVVGIKNSTLQPTASGQYPALLTLYNTQIIAMGNYTSDVVAGFRTGGESWSKTGAGVITNSAMVYVSAPATIATNNYSLWIDSGNARFDGNVGIGLTTAAYPLDVNGNMQVKYTTTGNTAILATGDTLYLNREGTNSVRLFDSVTAGQAPILEIKGYITAATAAKWIALSVDDTDDEFEIARQDTNIIQTHINMPLKVTGNISSSGVINIDDVQVVGNQQAHIINADGNLADITTKFNTLLSELETHGLLASS